MKRKSTLERYFKRAKDFAVTLVSIPYGSSLGIAY
ncbi:hypothetical protein J2S18_002921 [Eubacterium multiforme]|uniref:Uncharacterized protein n=1 Tax=Eubacterium multiforme TaxID=83339 RepID=A0ABT9UX97_9FIRM|nr:hypothetical protein [Eubacterium multiforme]